MTAQALTVEAASSGSLHSGSASVARFHSYLRPIATLLADSEVEEVMCNAPGEVFFERRGEMYRLEDVSLSQECVRGAIHVASSIARVTVGIGKHAAALVSAHVDSLRIAAAISPVALRGDCLCIRKHRKVRRTLDDYAEDGSFDHLLKRWRRALPEFDVGGDGRDVARYFERLMVAGASILVSGTPSGGKSTFLDMLVGLVPARRRVVLIEDTHEIEPRVPNHLCLIASEEAGVGIRELVRFSLRCRPDLLVVGELRGAEAADFVTAANSGPKAVASIHADGPLDALRKLESLALQANEGMPHDALRRQIASCVQVVVHFARVEHLRVPVAAVRVLGYEGGQYKVEDIFTRMKCQT